MRLSLSIPGKLILLSEYAVLQNAPALVVAVNRRLRLTVKSIAASHCLLTLPHLGVDVPFHVDDGIATPVQSHQPRNHQKYDRILTLTGAALKEGGWSKRDFGNVQVVVDSSEFFTPDGAQKLGLGSSAALTVGLLSAARQLRQPDSINNHQLLLDSHRLHNHFQGRAGSGIEVAASIFGGVLQYRMGQRASEFAPAARSVAMPKDLQMRFVWAGQSSSTADFLRGLKNYRDHNGPSFNRTMQCLVELAKEGCEAFSDGRINAFLAAVQSYYYWLAKLGSESRLPIISAEHRRIARTVYAGGGFYKPSGAGGGDFGVIFSSNESHIDEIAQRVADDGFTITDLKVGAEGIRFHAHADEGGINDSIRLPQNVPAIGR